MLSSGTGHRQCVLNLIKGYLRKTCIGSGQEDPPESQQRALMELNELPNDKRGGEEDRMVGWDMLWGLGEVGKESKGKMIDTHCMHT